MSNIRSFVSASLPLATLLIAAAVAAAEPAVSESDTPLTELPAVTVTASPFQRSADELAQPVEVLAGTELDRKRKSTIGETLEGELGVSAADFGPGVGRPVIRGQGGPRVAILENGISSMDVSTVSGDHAVSIDPAYADQIEIIKGPATLIFGSSASAGVINVVNTRLPERFTEGFFGFGEYSYGDNASEKQLAAEFNLGIGQGPSGVLIHADGASRRTDFFEIPRFANPDDPGNQGTLANSAVESRSGGVSLNAFGDIGSLGVALSQYETEYGLPQEAAAFIDLAQDRVDLLATLDAPWLWLEKLRLRVGVNDYRHTEFEEPGVAGTVFQNDETEARLEANHAPLGGWQGVIGLQVGARDFVAVGEEAFVQPVQTDTLGLFIVEARDYEWGRLEAGVRTERVNNDPAQTRPADGEPNVDPRGGEPQPDRNHSPLTVSLGSLFTLGERHHLRAGATRAQRAPVAEELYAFGPHLATGSFERGNSAFDLETAQNLEIGLDRHEGRWTWKLNVYVNQIADYIFLQEADANRNADNSTRAGSSFPGGDADGVPDGEADRVNADGAFVAPANGAGEELLLVDYRQADAKFTGFEAETAYELLSGPFKLSGRLFGDSARGRLDAGGNLPRMTPARYGAGLHAESAGWRGALTLTRVQDQDRVSSLETRTEGYDLLSADLSYTFALGGVIPTLYLRGRNLLDEDVRRHASFIKDLVPAPGRSLYAGLRLDF